MGSLHRRYRGFMFFCTLQKKRKRNRRGKPKKLKDCAPPLPQPPARQLQMSVTGVDVVQVRAVQTF